MERTKENMKIERGITLIALIITIILMLILAGVVLSLTIGKNGIFKTAKYAVEEQKIAEITEQLELKKGLIGVNNGGEVNTEEYLNYIQEEGNLNNKITQIEKIDETNTLIIVDGAYEYLLQQEKNGNLLIIYQGKESIIDRNLPKGTITVDSGFGTKTNCSFTVGLSINLTDEDSGVDTKNSKYIWNTSPSEIGITSSEWDNANAVETAQNILTKDINKVESWYLHVLVVDNAKNKVEVISNEIKVVANKHSHTSGCYITKTCSTALVVRLDGTWDFLFKCRESRSRIHMGKWIGRI